MNDDDVIICRLVSTSLLVTWHLQTPLSFSFLCDMVLAMLSVLVVSMGDGCEWQPLVMVMVVVMKQGWW